MKVILSRKGFDSFYGGKPSPVLPDGKLISLPIPEKSTSIKYTDLYWNRNKTYFQLIKQLGINKIKSDNTCHLDPDLYPLTYSRKSGWKAMFGQCKAAQSHLADQKIGSGDLFLFFGWFQFTKYHQNQLQYDNRSFKNGFHLIFGYLQIGQMMNVNDIVPDDWMKYHPHIENDYGKNNAIYFARDYLSWNKNIAGAGIFQFDDSLILTKKGCEQRSKWILPDFFKEVVITYHLNKNKVWIEDYFQSVSRGQEFVINGDKKMECWVKSLVENNYICS